jgi:hypothetical protein
VSAQGNLFEELITKKRRYKKGEGKMKKLLLVVMVVSLVALFVVPAMARGDKHHDRDPLNVAYADDFTLQINPFSVFLGGFANEMEDEISGSFNGFTGIAQVNQAAGSGNNQGNAVVAAITAQHDAVGIAVTDVDVLQGNFINAALVGFFNEYEDEISGSFNGMTGIAQVNQAAGFGNNQKNSVGVAATLKTEGAFAVADGDLIQVNAANFVANGAFNEISAEISRSFNGGVGVAQINQSPASLNNQANIVAVSAAGLK